MERLRPRERKEFSGFTMLEVEKMERLFGETELKEKLLCKEFSQKIARGFNCSAGRAGKPIVKWNMVQDWFENRQNSKVTPSYDVFQKTSIHPEACLSLKAYDSTQISKGDPVNPSDLEFEARSSKDSAWYDVDIFLAHRVVASGEPEVRVRFIGFGAEEDEWVDIKTAVRLRSVPFESSECQNVMVGDLVLCFQERRDQAIYYDARVIEIQKRMHDIRGCRCLFLVRYDHDKTEERVRLRRLCCRPIC